MKQSTIWLVLGTIGTLAVGVHAQDDGAQPKTVTKPKPKLKPTEPVVQPPDNSVLLVRDPLIQKDLALKPDQVKAVAALMDATDAQLWLVNPLPAAEGAEKAHQILTETETKLKAILTPMQQTRYRQISLQYQGLPAILRPEMSADFSLTDEQRKKIKDEVDKTLFALQKLDEFARTGQSREENDKYRRAVKAELRAQVQKILDAEQNAKWTLLVGKSFSFTKIKPANLRAPELLDTGQWINGQPLTLAGLRGHVVVVHFYTFGCENCIHNYPAYKVWATNLVPKGLTIIGIHTPETDGEHKVDQVQAKAKEAGLRFPVLIDNDKKNWNAWGNGIWPSVYVIDKEGYVRAWWFGELNWKGAQGQKILTTRIEELLSEGTTTQPAAAAPTASTRIPADTKKKVNN
jgi:peroxiredoxin